MNRDTANIIAILLFIFTFWFQPSSPFLVKWLTQSKDFTPKQVYGDLFPLWSYSQFFLLPGGIFAQYVSFRTIFAFGALLSFLSNVFLLWGESMEWMMASEVANGSAVGTFSILMAFLYTAFPEHLHQKVTSYSRATTLIATTVSASTGQLIVNQTKSVLAPLCVSIGMGLLNWLTAFFLPPSVPPSNKKHGQIQAYYTESQSSDGDIALEAQQSQPSMSESNQESQTSVTDPEKAMAKETGESPLIPKEPRRSRTQSLQAQWIMFKDNYTHSMAIWSVWSGICLAVHMLVLIYWQSVMNQIDPNVNYNGYVSTSAYAIAAATTLIPTKIESFLNKVADWLLVLFPVLYGLCLLLLSRETIIYFAYGWLILYHSLFEFMLSVSSVQIARKTGRPKQFGIVFSLSMVVALLFQNFLQLLVGKHVWDLEPVQQYRFFAFVFFGTSAICLIGNVVLEFRKRKANVTLKG